MKLIDKTCPKCGANLEFNLGDKEVKVGNGSIFGNVISTNWSSLWGYNSVKDLYNNLDFKDATLVASDGLYKN